MNWKERIEERHNAENLCIKFAEQIAFPVEFISSQTIFTKKMAYEEMKLFLSELCRIGLSPKLRWYDISESTLAVKYECRNKVCVLFYLSDPKSSLEKISNGKCKIVRTASEIIGQKIVCETK